MYLYTNALEELLAEDPNASVRQGKKLAQLMMNTTFDGMTAVSRLITFLREPTNLHLYEVRYIAHLLAFGIFLC